jgi:hypothetical protein
MSLALVMPAPREGRSLATGHFRAKFVRFWPVWPAMRAYLVVFLRRFGVGSTFPAASLLTATGAKSANFP